MKICFVCNEYPPAPHGGIGTFVRTLAVRLVSLDHEVFVVGFDPGCEAQRWTEDQGVRVLHIPVLKRPRWTLRFGRWNLDAGIVSGRRRLSEVVGTVVRDRAVDIVESYDWSGPLWSPPSRPLVVRLHGANTAFSVYEGKRPSVVLRFLERRNVAFANALVAVSRHIGGTTLAALGLPGRQFTVIPNGVDLEVFRPAPVKRDPLEVLYVGGITRRKGIPDLMAAAQEVLRSVDDVHFKLIGHLPENGQREALLEGLLSEVPARWHGRFEFVGRVPHAELPRHYSRAALVVVPSRAEAFGLTCVEAMACGAPVVMTSLASGPELVEHGRTGLLANPTDSGEFAASIIQLLRSESLRRDIGSAARSWVSEKLDINGLTTRNLEFYQEVIERHGRC